ncbi:MAG: hypothetical protein HXY34_02760 [Candidatus Thorarchaeota archaeon]|nr:hypothetical protein [Candidatus Thorarchaeota archaeon]
MKNSVPVVLCLLGGLLLLQASWLGDIGFLAVIIAYAQTAFSAIADAMGILLRVLLWIAALGGIAVIVGSILIAVNRIRFAKFIIGLGAGIGLIGLIIMLVTVVVSGGIAELLGLAVLVSQSIAWIGVILTVIGRRAIKTE